METRRWFHHKSLVPSVSKAYVTPLFGAETFISHQSSSRFLKSGDTKRMTYEHAGDTGKALIPLPFPLQRGHKVLYYFVLGGATLGEVLIQMCFVCLECREAAS